MTSSVDSPLLAGWLAAGLGLAITAGVLVFMVRWKGRERAERTAIWRKFALDNRLEMTVEPRSWLRHGANRIRGRIGELDLELSTYEVRVGKTTQTWARVETKGRGPQGSFSVEPADLRVRIAAWFRAPRTLIGDSQFDSRFFVRSLPPELARDVLDDAVRASYAKLTRKPRLHYADGTSQLTWHCGLESVEQLSSAVEFLAMLRGSIVRGSARAELR